MKILTFYIWVSEVPNWETWEVLANKIFYCDIYKDLLADTLRDSVK